MKQIHKIALVTPSRSVIDPIKSFDITRSLGSPANASVVLDSTRGEFDPDNPDCEEWVQTDASGYIHAMQYDVSGNELLYRGKKELLTGIIDYIDPSGYSGAGDETVTFRLSDKMNHLPYIKFMSELYQNAGSRVVLGDVLLQAGIPRGFSPEGGLTLNNIQFVDENYQNVINLLLQAEIAGGCIDGAGLFRVFPIVTDNVALKIPQTLIADIRPSYGKSKPITCVRVALQPKEDAVSLGEDKEVGTYQADITEVVKLEIYYSADKQLMLSNPKIDPLEGHENISKTRVINRGNYAEIYIYPVAGGGHYNFSLSGREVKEGDAGFEVIYFDSELEHKFGGRIEKKINNFLIPDYEQALNVAMNYMTLENWKRVSYSVKLNSFLDYLPGQTILFKHLKFGNEIKLLLSSVRHSWRAGQSILTTLQGWKVGKFTMDKTPTGKGKWMVKPKEEVIDGEHIVENETFTVTDSPLPLSCISDPRFGRLKTLSNYAPIGKVYLDGVEAEIPVNPLHPDRIPERTLLEGQVYVDWRTGEIWFNYWNIQARKVCRIEKYAWLEKEV